MSKVKVKVIKNLYQQSIDLATMVGAVPNHDMVICYVVPDDKRPQYRTPAPEVPRLPGQAKRPAITAAGSSATVEPCVFAVIAVGRDVDIVKVNDFCSITFMAGDKFAGSSILAVHKDDITFVYGEGLFDEIEVEEDEVAGEALDAG